VAVCSKKGPIKVILDVGGVGYLVAVPLLHVCRLGDVHAEVTLLIHTHVRETPLRFTAFFLPGKSHFFEYFSELRASALRWPPEILSGMMSKNLYLQFAQAISRA